MDYAIVMHLGQAMTIRVLFPIIGESEFTKPS